MHARDLIELAALVAVHGPRLVGGQRLPEWCLEQYWTASRCRHERWMRTLKACAAPVGSSPRAAHDHWQSLRPTLEEIFTGDLLTRIWTAVASAYDAQRPAADAGPIARSVLSGQLDARNRALNVLVYGHGFELQQVVRLDRLRRRAERWNDLLLANLRIDFDVRELAFEPETTREFSADLRAERVPSDLQTAQFAVGSIRSAFRGSLTDASPNSDLNRRIAASIFACFRPLPIDTVALPKAPWLERLHSATSDSLGWIAELLALDGSELPPPPLGRRV